MHKWGSLEKASSDTTLPFPLTEVIFEVYPFSQIPTKHLILSVDYDCIQLFIYVIFLLIYSESCLIFWIVEKFKRYMRSGLILYDSKLSW